MSDVVEKKCKYDVSLSQNSTLHIGGGADLFFEPENIEEIQQIVLFCRRENVPYFVLGRGSNVLFDDSGYRGAIIKIDKKLSSVSSAGNKIYAEAGVWMPVLARLTKHYKLHGLEHLIGIPGNLGGGIVMNAGSQRMCLGDSVLAVEVVDDEGSRYWVERDDCLFSYRESIFQKKKLIVVRAVLACERSTNSSRKGMIGLLRERRGKFPLQSLNCGSVFKSSADLYSRYGPPGKIIEDLGLKGYRVGGAFVSEKHGNFFLNDGNATSSDYVALIDFVRERVFNAIGVKLEPEVIILDEYGKKKY